MHVLKWLAAGVFTLLGGCSTTLVEPMSTAGRATSPAPALKSHVLYIGKHGDLLDPESASPIRDREPVPVDKAVKDRCPSPRDGKRDLECEYVAALIDAYVQADQDHCRSQGGVPSVPPEEQAENPSTSGPAFAEGECKGAVQPTIYIHGGLNDFEDVRARARVIPRPDQKECSADLIT